MSQNPRKHAIAAFVMALCTVAAVPLFAQVQAVQVVNNPNVTVSNTPNVNVANTPSVSVTNTPSVNVANTPTVTLESGASVAITSPHDGQGNPTPVAVLDAFQAYEDSCQILFSGAQFGSCDFQPIAADKQLVVQEFDALGSIETGLQPQYAALYRQGAMVVHYFPTIRTSSFAGLDSFATNGETRVYIPPAVTPVCGVDLTNPSSGGLYVCALSGYLVDAPLTSSSDAAPAQHRFSSLPAPLVRNSGTGRQPSNSER